MTETGPPFKASSKRPEKGGTDLAIPGLVVKRFIHYTTATPAPAVINTLASFLKIIC